LTAVLYVLHPQVLAVADFDPGQVAGGSASWACSHCADRQKPLVQLKSALSAAFQHLRTSTALASPTAFSSIGMHKPLHVYKFGLDAPAEAGRRHMSLEALYF